MANDGPSSLYQPPERELEQELTIDYMGLPWSLSIAQYATRPWFTLLQMQTMLLDHQVWFGLQLRNAPLIQAEVRVKSPSSEVQEFVQNEWDKFWARFAPKVLATKYFGYAGFEVIYENHRGGRWDGALTIANVKDISPADVRPMRQAKGKSAGKVAGVGVHGHRHSMTGESSKTPTRLFGMKGLWLNYMPIFGSLFGEPATYKAYPAWWEKAMPGGAYDLRRLRGVKDAWIGDLVKYPLNKTFTRPDGTILSGKDIVREIAELRASGGVVMVPSDVDNNGNPLFDYVPPREVADTSVIRNWIEDDDWDIFDGLLVPREVVEASASGSGYSGRSIPFVMFLAIGDTELLGYVMAWKQQIGEALVVRNMGHSANDFEMEPVPLLETVAEKMGGQQTAGPVGGTTDEGGYHRGHPTHPPVDQVSTRRIQAMGRLGAMQMSATETAAPGARWITIGAKDGEGGTPVLIDAKGNIHAGPRELTGKNLSSLSDDKGDSLTFDPGEWDVDDRPALEPTNRFHEELLGAAEDYGVNANDLKATAEWLWAEKRQRTEERESGKKAARIKTGLTMQDLARLENAGLDYTAAAKVDGATGAKLRFFDQYAREIAREYPELGLGDPDSGDDLSASLWSLLREGKQPAPPKHDTALIREAATMLQRAGESGIDESDLPDQFAIVEEPTDTRRKRRAAAAAAVVAAEQSGADLFRRLETLLKKNGRG